MTQTRQRGPTFRKDQRSNWMMLQLLVCLTVGIYMEKGRRRGKHTSRRKRKERRPKDKLIGFRMIGNRMKTSMRICRAWLSGRKQNETQVVRTKHKKEKGKATRVSERKESKKRMRRTRRGIMPNRIWEELGMESPKVKRMRTEEKSILEKEEERMSTRDTNRGDGIYDMN